MEHVSHPFFSGEYLILHIESLRDDKHQLHKWAVWVWLFITVDAYTPTPVCMHQQAEYYYVEMNGHTHRTGKLTQKSTHIILVQSKSQYN